MPGLGCYSIQATEHLARASAELGHRDDLHSAQIELHDLGLLRLVVVHGDRAVDANKRSLRDLCVPRGIGPHALSEDILRYKALAAHLFRVAAEVASTIEYRYYDECTSVSARN